MKPDPILKELWEIKDRLAREAGYDPHRFLANLRLWEAEHADLAPVARPPKERGRSAVKRAQERSEAAWMLRDAPVEEA
ncbi:MAG: hypothetical protein COY42_27915 [Armatimonadetes bacterium CG_4_10_14_0_8_um_filter_66_14]|nr:MAG: hypothetical protein COY42_27915 [Armatimonadetes bacterium CG_4_10_14_0_8_um_filter_66_14]